MINSKEIKGEEEKEEKKEEEEEKLLVPLCLSGYIIICFVNHYTSKYMHVYLIRIL